MYHQRHDLCYSRRQAPSYDAPIIKESVGVKINNTITLINGEWLAATNLTFT